MTVLHRRKLAIGIDVGQAHDPTAICVAARIATAPLNPIYKDVVPGSQRYEVLHLERLALGMPYPRQVEHLSACCYAPPLARLSPLVFVDYTGVGRPVFDMFAERPMLRRAQGVVITGGAWKRRARRPAGQCQRENWQANFNRCCTVGK